MPNPKRIKLPPPVDLLLVLALVASLQACQHSPRDGSYVSDCGPLPHEYLPTEGPYYPCNPVVTFQALVADPQPEVCWEAALWNPDGTIDRWLPEGCVREARFLFEDDAGLRWYLAEQSRRLDPSHWLQVGPGTTHQARIRGTVNASAPVPLDDFPLYIFDLDANACIAEQDDLAGILNNCASSETSALVYTGYNP